MEGAGEELSRGRRGVLASLFTKAEGKVRVLKSWYKGDQDQDRDQDKNQDQDHDLDKDHSTPIPSPGSREGQPSLLRPSLSPSTSSASLTVSSSQPATITASPKGRSSISHGPWVTVGRTAFLPQSSDGSQLGQPSVTGSRLGQSSLLRASLSASTSRASLFIGTPA